VAFARIARNAGSVRHRKPIEIGGIGAVIYAFLAVATPLHDLLVSMALLFFTVAAIAALHLLYVQRHWRLLGAGLLCCALVACCAVMYYGDILFAWLAVTQKLSLLVSMSWLLALDLFALNRAAQSGPRRLT
jgi:hypothetical protein